MNAPQPLLPLLPLLLLFLLPQARAADLSGTLSGTVTDADGAPLAGVPVYAYDVRGSYALATSRNDGAWSLTDLPAGTWRVLARPEDDAQHPDAVERYWPGVPGYCDAEVIALDADSGRSGVDLSLPRSARVTGRLLDSAGAPVTGAFVVCAGTAEPYTGVFAVGLSGADGRFTATGLDSPGTLISGDAMPSRCIFYADGAPDQYPGPDPDQGTYDQGASLEFSALRGGITDIGDRTLLPGITVTGTVYSPGPDGERPVSGGTVYAYSSGQVVGVPIGADGTYIAAGLPPGEVVVWAQVTGLATTYWPDSDRPGDRIDVLEEGMRAGGADLHMPAESLLSLALQGTPAPGSDLSDVSVLLYNDTYTVGRGASADIDGYVELTALHDGAYTLQIYGSDAGFTDDYLRYPSGDSSAGEPRIVQIDGLTSLDVPLTPGARISGAITDETGAPVYGAEVIAQSADASFFTRADRDGRYALPGLPAGSYTVAVSYAAFCAGDPGWTGAWWPDARTAALAAPVIVSAGGAADSTDVVLSQDDDHDGMGDAWERRHGLDDGRDDAGEDADGDGFTNYEEWLLDSDPAGSGAAAACGCGEGKAGALLLPAIAAVGRRRRRKARDARSALRGAGAVQGR